MGIKRKIKTENTCARCMKNEMFCNAVARQQQWHCIEFNILLFSLRYILIIHLLSSSSVLYSCVENLFVFVYNLAKRQNGFLPCVRTRIEEQELMYVTDSIMITHLYFCQFSQLTYTQTHFVESKMVDIVSLMLLYSFFSLSFLCSLYIFIFRYVNMQKHYARPFQFVRIDYVLIKTNRDHILRERERAHCIHTFILWWLTTQHYYTLNFGLARTSLSLTHTHTKIARSFVIPTRTWSIIRQPMIKFKSRICLVKDTWNRKNVEDESKGTFSSRTQITSDLYTKPSAKDSTQENIVNISFKLNTKLEKIKLLHRIEGNGRILFYTRMKNTDGEWHNYSESTSGKLIYDRYIRNNDSAQTVKLNVV